MKPTIGRIVQYVLTDEDSIKINRRRTDGDSIASRIREDKWPIGAQAHIGNKVVSGQTVAMVITAVWANERVNGQLLLDGSDTYWVTTVSKSEEVPMAAGTWCWPVVEPTRASTPEVTPCPVTEKEGELLAAILDDAKKAPPSARTELIGQYKGLVEAILARKAEGPTFGWGGQFERRGTGATTEAPVNTGSTPYNIAAAAANASNANR